MNYVNNKIENMKNYKKFNGMIQEFYEYNLEILLMEVEVGLECLKEHIENDKKLKKNVDFDKMVNNFFNGKMMKDIEKLEGKGVNSNDFAFMFEILADIDAQIKWLEEGFEVEF